MSSGRQDYTGRVLTYIPQIEPGTHKYTYNGIMTCDAGTTTSQYLMLVPAGYNVYITHLLVQADVPEKMEVYLYGDASQLFKAYLFGSLDYKSIGGEGVLFTTGQTIYLKIKELSGYTPKVSYVFEAFTKNI